MNIKFIKKRMVATILVSVLLAPTTQVLAADATTVLSEGKEKIEITIDKEVTESFNVSESAAIKALKQGLTIVMEGEVAKEETLKAKRQSVVDYASQFIGNPYVYGGTSLTRGTDCSGFVRSVYAYFGVSLPRTSSAMRSVGYEVSYSEIQPGDIVCYYGHVGIYAGNGQIVNAIDESRSIGMSSATYAKIITIRRIFWFV